MNLRPETSLDHAAIRDVTRLAFAPMPYSSGDEPDIIERLRVRGRLVHSLVAELDSQIVGHVAFSKMLSGDALTDWYALGPIAVKPSHQRQGIGKSMIAHGVAILRGNKAKGLCLVGDPNYYSRFGFVAAAPHTPDGEPEAYFQMLRFGESWPEQRLRFDPAFYG